MAFLRSRWVEAPPGVEELDPATLAPGFRAAGVSAGIKADGAPDLGLLHCDAERVASAYLLTSNAAAAAPIRVCRERCDPAAVRAAVVNSGNANAATGKRGYEHAVAMQEEAARALGVEPRSVAVASTGVVGRELPIDAVREGIATASERLAMDGGGALAEAMVTTDRGPKHGTLRCQGVTVSAQAKGAGMIQPGFATTLCFVQTDAAVDEAPAALRVAAGRSFERITVDGQQSTNDSMVLQATGEAGVKMPDGLLEAVLLQLALEVVADGEGATRTARVRVGGAASADEAERVARAIANSPLVKTAIHGADPNWGRVVQAAGMALAGEELELGAEDVDAEELGGDGREIELAVRLGRGDAEAELYCSDLSCDYVKLNAEYTT
jgi:glutamate N-acetyltransferase/amino-acid N-acetyltransferase